jgi:hypothetical protein
MLALHLLQSARSPSAHQPQTKPRRSTRPPPARPRTLTQPLH